MSGYNEALEFHVSYMMDFPIGNFNQIFEPFESIDGD